MRCHPRFSKENADIGAIARPLRDAPIPAEYSMDPAVINKAIDEAIAEAEAQGVKGKQVTPFLLAKVKDITGGDSLDSNIQLVYNNAALAAEIAVDLAKD